MYCSLTGFSIHGISQTRILEWVAISFSRASSWPTNQACVSCIAGEFFTAEPPRKPTILEFNDGDGGGMTVELFQILKDDAVKELHSICQQIWKTQQWPRDWKGSVFIPIPKKGNAKECSDDGIVALISRASKVMLKILQAKLQQYVNCELSDVQAGFRKGRGTRNQIANICWIIEKARGPENIYFCFIDYAKAFDCVDHNKLWKILQEMGIPDHMTCLLRNLYAG